MDRYIGKRIDGRYEIEKLIGVGGMANVYKATDLLENRPIAIKILREEFLENEDLVRRFKNESKAIGQLNHQHIVKVFDVSVSDKLQYIAMEYLDGVTLKDYMTQRGVLTFKETLFFIEQVLDALQHAHEKGIIHRDIKPQNIMVLPNGNVKVMDFGIARFSRSESHTVTDKAIGSVHYISPEQAKGDVIDARADLYSVGVMMYEMLTGKLPFDSDSAVQVAIKQISDAAVPPCAINPDIPKPLEAITMRAMAKDVKKRYQSAAEMLVAISEFKRNPSIRFEYDYMDDNSPTRYIDKVVSKAKSIPSGGQPRKKKKFKLGFTLPVLAGVAVAVAAGSLILCALIINTSGLFSSKADVELANFVGKAYSEVKGDSTLTASFKFDVKEVYSATAAEGLIIRQNPNPPKKVKEGTKVTIYVSKGKEIVKVPEMAGTTRGEAQKALSELGLSVKIVPETNEAVEAGRVIRTDPAAGTKLETGAEIILYVSKSANLDNTTVPQLVGLASVADAQKLLDASRLSMGAPVQVESELPAGTIVSQSPEAGSEVPRGSRITITVSTGVVKPKEKTISVTVNFDANVTSFGWTAYLGGAPVSSFEAKGNTTWSFQITGTTNQTLAISNGITVQSTEVDFQNSPGITFNVAGVPATPTPAPATPTPAPATPPPATPVPATPIPTTPAPPTAGPPAD